VHDPDRDGEDLAHAMDEMLKVQPAPAAFSPMPGAEGVGMPAPIPEATPVNMACLRGPCRHYWEVEQFHESSNPADTPGLKNRRIIRACICGPRETDITDETVYSCNKWDPEVDSDRDDRRNAWEEANPEIMAQVKEGGNGVG